MNFNENLFIVHVCGVGKNVPYGSTKYIVNVCCVLISMLECIKARNASFELEASYKVSGLKMKRSSDDDHELDQYNIDICPY